MQIVRNTFSLVIDCSCVSKIKLNPVKRISKHLNVWPSLSNETTSNGVLSATDDAFTQLVSNLSSQDCCVTKDGLPAETSDLERSTEDAGVTESESATNLPPPVLSDLVESFSERSEMVAARFSAAPWTTLLGLSASEATFLLRSTHTITIE